MAYRPPNLEKIFSEKEEWIMPIIAGILILMCAGLMVGHGYHMFRHKEAPNKEPTHQTMMHRDHDHGQAVGTPQEGIPDGQAEKNLNQEPVKEDEPEP
jgi:hypothetical protein